MNFTLHVTDNCNLACTYCRLEHAPRAMDMAVIRAAVALSSKGGSRTGFCFYGGEPLLERNLIYEAVAFCEALRQKTGHVFEYRLNTNGLLMDEEFAAFAARHKMRLGLSFDGRGQDVCRLFPDGSPSSALLASKIPMILSYLPDTIVMLTFTPRTLPDLADSVADLFEMGFRHLYTTPAIGDRVCWEEADLALLRRQYRKIAGLYAGWSAAGERFYFPAFDTKIAAHIDNRRYCMGLCHIGRGQYSVTPDGTLYPCTGFVGRPEFALGTVFEGFSPAAAKRLQNHKTPESCRACALKTRCTHACGCVNLIETGTVDEVSPMQCQHEQLLIEVADELAAELFGRRVPAFMEKHYGARTAL